MCALIIIIVIITRLNSGPLPGNHIYIYSVLLFAPIPILYYIVN